MARWLIAIVGLSFAGCARDGILHAEPLVRRATCTGDGFAAFGYPIHDADCDANIIALGDGCYVSERPDEVQREPRQLNSTPAGLFVWGHHLYQCDYDVMPDGHIGCVEDTLPSRGRAADGESPYVGNVLRAHLPGQAEPHVDTPIGRCRARLYTWEAATLPRPDPVTLVVRAVFVVSGPDEQFSARDASCSVDRERRIAEDGVELARMIGDDGRGGAVAAHVCNGTAGEPIAIASGLPSRLAHEIRDLIAPCVRTVPANTCRWLSVHYDVHGG